MPSLLFLLLLLLTAAAWAARPLAAASRARRLRALATQMQFSHADLFQLAARVADQFPVAGVADVRVYDVLWATLDDGAHCYIFTAEYTIGVLGARRRARRVATLTEPPGRVQVADEHHTLLEQYRQLIAQSASAEAPRQ